MHSCKWCRPQDVLMMSMCIEICLHPYIFHVPPTIWVNSGPLWIAACLSIAAALGDFHALCDRDIMTMFVACVPAMRNFHMAPCKVCRYIVLHCACIEWSVVFFRYAQHFGLNEPTDEIYALLSHIAKQNNLILKTRSTAGMLTYLLAIFRF